MRYSKSKDRSSIPLLCFATSASPTSASISFPRRSKPTAKLVSYAHGSTRLSFWPRSSTTSAYLYYLRGEYARAISSYEITRELCVQAGDPYHRALCDLDQSEMYLELNMSRDGARLAESARTGFQKLKMRYEIAKATAFIGLASNQLGDRARALKLFATARKLFVNERNQLWPAVLDLYRAVVLFDDGEDEDAAELCTAAMDVFVANSIHSRAAVCEVLLARLALRSGEFTIAQEYCRSAIDRLETLEAPAIACHAYLSMGEARETPAGFRRRAHIL